MEMINKCILVSEKSWHKKLFSKLKKYFKKIKWILIDNKVDFNKINLSNLKPDKIFIPHWSFIIDKSIFEKFECIIFHMTDLPYGRGGSPLQNLIIRNNKSTKISAIKVESGIDTGGIYLKNDLDLSGTAKVIFDKSSDIIYNMIYDIIIKDLKPIQQKGKITIFKRRKPYQSSIKNLSSLEKVFDYIRMLDCEGYPRAFIETQNLKFEFSNAKYDKNKKLINANVRILKK